MPRPFSRFRLAAFLLTLALPALAADPATNAPAATLEQLLAEPWRQRLSPEADPVANVIDVEIKNVFGIRFEERAIGDIPDATRGEMSETLRSSFRLKAGRCVEFAEQQSSLLFSAYTRDGLPDDIRATLGPPKTAPGPFLVVTRLGGSRRNYPMRFVLVPEDSPAAPQYDRFSLGRFHVWPLD